jgi:hypothetical protein
MGLELVSFLRAAELSGPGQHEVTGGGRTTSKWTYLDSQSMGWEK